MNPVSLPQFTAAFMAPARGQTPQHFDVYVRDSDGRGLWLSIDKKRHVVSECQFLLPENDRWAPYFNLMLPMISGGDIEVLLTLSWEHLAQAVAMMKPQTPEERAVVQVFMAKYRDQQLPLAFLPGDLLRQAICQYLGLSQVPHAWTSSASRDSNCEQLLCRCFGVSNYSLERYLEKNPNATLAQISGELKAGAGCATCHDDIELLAAHYCSSPIAVHVNGSVFVGECQGPGQLSPAEATLLVDDYLLAHWPQATVHRCAGRRLELLVPEHYYDQMVNEMDAIREELSDILGAMPYVLLQVRV